MKRIYLLLIAFIFLGGQMVKAQTCSFPCTSLENPLLKDIQGNIHVTKKIVIYGLNPAANFRDVAYPGDILGPQEDVDATKPCPTAYNCIQNNATGLFYEVYYSTDYANYASCPLPAIIFFHGGSFSDCVAAGTSNLFTQLAVRGFVVFNVEYRAGRLLQTQPESDAFRWATAQQLLAFYKAFQDARGAIRSILKRQANETTGDTYNDPYRIDVNNIFLGGASAGSATALNAAYTRRRPLLIMCLAQLLAALIF